MKLTLFGCIAMIALNFLLIPRFELIGAALATTLTCFILMVSILVYIERHFKVRLSLKTLFFSSLSAGIVIILSFLLPSGAFTFLFSGALLFALYFTSLFFFGELTQEDLAPLKKLVRRS